MNTLTLTHPKGAIALPVHSKSPIETIILNTVVARSMDGTLYTHASPQSKIQLHYALDGLDENVTHQLRNFIKDKIGDDFIVADADTSRRWRAKIINDPILSQDSGPNSSMSITFLGVQIQ